MLKELIDQFYIDQQVNKKQDHFYVTDAGKCPRAVFFKFKNAPRKKLEPRVLRIFEKGEHFHRNIFDVLYRLRIGVVTEVPMPGDGLVSGRADAILSIKNKNYVLDIKSMNSMLFRKMIQPKEENIYQLQIYLHYFCIKDGILLYINKDDQDIREFHLKYNQGLVESLLEDFKDLKQKLANNIVPERFGGWPKNWQCRYCQFKEICRMAGEKEIAWEDFKKKMEAEEKSSQG
jgi:CRISPR/Cas system-associated exonuclease Cas4 (RecB family)